MMNATIRCCLLLAALVLLVTASAPAAELGINDQRVSFMGIDGDPTVDAKTPVMAFNPVDNQVLMVWSADMVDGHFQIWGQRIHAPTGALAGAPFQISFSDTPEFDAIEPDVVFSPFTFEYLVVWSSDVLMDGAEEIHGQRISRHGELVGDRGFRISDMGADDSDPTFDANTPAVAWNSTLNEFMVVWAGDDDAATLEGEFVIFGQRLSSNGSEFGTNDFAAAPLVVGFDFFDPDLAHNPTDNQYLLVFEAYWRTIVPPGPEIAGDVLGPDGLTLTPGSRYMGIMGPSGTDEFHGKNPVVEYNANRNEYLVAWDGDHLFNEEIEVWARWVIASPEIAYGTDILRMSDMGIDGSTQAAGLHPALAYDSNLSQYMVVWQGDDFPGTTADAEPEIFGQLTDEALVEIGTNDFRLSDMGPDPGPYEAASSGVVFNPSQDLYLVGWTGDDDQGGLVSGEEETHLQRWGTTPTGVDNQPGPRRFALHANVPNPFNPSTTIYFDVPVGAGEVSLRIYDVSGRLVRTLVQGKLSAGQHQVQWQGKDQSGDSVASGVYHLRMQAGEFKSARKLTLVQ